LAHKLEKARVVELKPQAATGSIDTFWSDTRILVKNYWQVIVIVIMAYMIFFYMSYIKGLNARLESMENALKSLMEICKKDK